MPILGSLGGGSVRSFGLVKIPTVPVPVITISLFSFTTGDDVTSITIPGGIQNGDIGVLHDAYANTSESTLVTPTNWTSLSSIQTQLGTGSSRFGQSISYRILTAALAGTSVTGINSGAGTVSKVMYIFRPASTVSLVSISSPDIKTSAPPTLPTASTISGGQVHIAGWRSSAGSTITRSLTPTDNQSISVNSSAVYSTAVMPPGSSTATLVGISGTSSFATQTCYSLTFT